MAVLPERPVKGIREYIAGEDIAEGDDVMVVATMFTNGCVRPDGSIGTVQDVKVYLKPFYMQHSSGFAMSSAKQGETCRVLVAYIEDDE